MTVELRFPEYAIADFRLITLFIADYFYWFLADMHTWFNLPVSLSPSVALPVFHCVYPGRLSCRTGAGRQLVGKRTINCVLIICTLHAAGHSFVWQSDYLSAPTRIYLPRGRGCKSFYLFTQTNFAIAFIFFLLPLSPLRPESHWPVTFAGFKIK